MSALRATFAFACLLVAVASAHASTVYKCTSEHGAIAFQDRPCAKEYTQYVIELEDEPPSGPPSITLDDPDKDSVDTAPPAVAPAIPLAEIKSAPERKALRPLWLCTRAEDGSEYTSLNGVTYPHMVPLGVLGYPGKSVGSAYRPGGVGVSAPELSKTPVDASRDASAAGEYTEVEDSCLPATPAQTCDYLHKEYDRLHAKLRRAFKDEQAILQPQEDQVSAELAGC